MQGVGRGRAAPRAPRSAGTRLLLALLLLEGVAAVGGGATLLADTSGASAGLPSDALEPLGLSSYLVPGLVLGVGLGFGALVLALGVGRAGHPRHGVRPLAILERSTGQHWAWAGTITLGVGLMLWIAVQMTVVDFLWLQPAMFVVGAALAVLPLAPGPRRDLAARAGRGHVGEPPVVGSCGGVTT